MPKRSTHCRRGHEYGPDNAYWKKNGTRQCKPCTLASNARRISEGRATPYDAARMKRWRDANQHKIRGYYVRYRYRLSPEAYQAMVERQGGLCAICRQPETLRTSSGRIRPLAIDHDHQTGAVRGLLCQNCNQGIGRFDDDPERLRRAIEYLARPALRLVESG